MSEHADPREEFLARAAVRDYLAREGALTLDEAFDGLIEPFLEIIGPYCSCTCEIAARLAAPLPKRRVA